MTWHTLDVEGAEYPRDGQLVVIRVDGKEREAIFRWRHIGWRFDPPDRMLLRGIQFVREWRTL